MLRRDFLLTLAALATKTKKPKKVKIRLRSPITMHKHDTANVIAQIKRGFSFWSDVSNVEFLYVTGKCHVEVLTTEIYNGLINGINTHARGRYLYKTNQILLHSGYIGPYHGNNPLNNPKPYYWDPFPNEKYIATCIAHEFGHHLGLDHSSDPLAVMNPNITAEKLSSSEIKFAQKKFGAK